MTDWLTDDEMAAWLRLVAIAELLPGVLDAQLRRDASLSHFEYFVLAVLSEAPERTLRMTELAQRTNATLTRLSHVARRLEDRRLIERFPCPTDARATNARLTSEGWSAVVDVAPRHVAHVRERVLGGLEPDQVLQLIDAGDAILARLDPQGRMTALYRPEPSPTTRPPRQTD